MAAPIVPIIISVAGVLIRTTAKQAPKLLQRFKNSKKITNPTTNQINKAERITGKLDNFSKINKNKIIKNDTARPNLFQKLTGTGRTANQKTTANIKTGESRRTATKSAAAGLGSGAVGGAGAVVAINSYLVGNKQNKKQKSLQQTDAFKQAFRKAKNNKQKTFIFQGNKYHTLTKVELPKSKPKN
jgi:hypothetical protein